MESPARNNPSAAALLYTRKTPPRPVYGIRTRFNTRWGICRLDTSSQTDEPFLFRFRVRFCECDPQRVAFNGCYGMYIDLAVLEFMRSLGLGDALVKGTFDYQVVKQTVEWKGPAHFDDVVEVAVWAKRLGTTSFVIATEFRIAGSDTVSATGETVYVLVDSATLTKMSLSPELRQAFQQGARGLCVDHANSTPQRPAGGRPAG